MSRPPLTAAQRALVEQWLPLAYKCARAQARRHERLRTYVDDLKQAAALGLIHAAQKYRDDQGAAFPTYAFPWIRVYLNNAGRSFINTSYVPEERGPDRRQRRGFDNRSDQDVYAADFRALMSTTPEYDGGLDAQRIWAEAIGPNGIADFSPQTQRGRPGAEDPQRDADIYLRVHFGDESAAAAGARYGVSRERARQIINRTGHYFKAWAHEVRASAMREAA